MRRIAGSVKPPAASCRNRRRGSFIASSQSRLNKRKPGVARPPLDDVLIFEYPAAEWHWRRRKTNRASACPVGGSVNSLSHGRVRAEGGACRFLALDLRNRCPLECRP